MITQVTQHPNRHRLAPVQLGFALRCKNIVRDGSIQRIIWLACSKTVKQCAVNLKQNSSFVTITGRVKTQIPIGRYLFIGLR